MIARNCSSIDLDTWKSVETSRVNYQTDRKINKICHAIKYYRNKSLSSMIKLFCFQLFKVSTANLLLLQSSIELWNLCNGFLGSCCALFGVVFRLQLFEECRLFPIRVFCLDSSKYSLVQDQYYIEGDMCKEAQ